MRFSLVVFLFALHSNARTSLYAPTPSPTPVQVPSVALKRSPSMTSKHQPGVARSWSMVTRGNPIGARSGLVAEPMKAVHLGEMVFATINQSVIAFSDSKSPVTAIVVLPTGERLTLAGEATLEKNSKRILVEFTRIRASNSDNVFTFKSQTLDSNGVLGLEGDYHSGEKQLFAAEFLAAAAAGFADSSISRTTNALGQIQDDNSVDTKSKKAATAAMSRTADHFAEKVRSAPEYSVLEGPLTVKVLVLDQPTRKL